MVIWMWLKDPTLHSMELPTTLCTLVSRVVQASNKRVFQEIREQLVMQEPTDFQDLTVTPDRMEHQESQEHQELRAKLELSETRVLRD